MPKKIVVDTAANDHWHSISDSSNILGAGVENGKLVVEYHKMGRMTGRYQYTTSDIIQGQGLCCRMEMATSKGSFVRQYIQSLPYAKIG